MHRGSFRTVWLLLFFILSVLECKGRSAEKEAIQKSISLPEPILVGEKTVEEVLQFRRSVREYAAEPIPLLELSQLLWAAQGITSAEGYRTTPSAGALYPLETYVVAGNVTGLNAGIYKYAPVRHELLLIREGDFREALSEEAQGVVEHLLSLKDCLVGILLREALPETVKVSLRTRQPLKANKIAEALGGGGHPNAAGYRTQGPLSRAREEVVREIKKWL